MSQDTPDAFHVISPNKVKVPGGGQCANCLMRMDGASAVDTKEKIMPKPGDGCVCSFCGALLVYDEKLTTHLMTEDELAAHSPEQQATLKGHSQIFKEAAKCRASMGKTFMVIKLS